MTAVLFVNSFDFYPKFCVIVVVIRFHRYNFIFTYSIFSKTINFLLFQIRVEIQMLLFLLNNRDHGIDTSKYRNCSSVGTILQLVLAPFNAISFAVYSNLA